VRAPARILTLAAIPLVAAACDWTAFDDLQNRTPVLVVGAPSGYAGADFGRVVLPLSPPPGGSPAARFVVSAVTSPALAEIDLDAAGHPSGQGLDPGAISQGGAFPITALAEVPGAGQVLMGAPQAGGGRLYLMTVGAPGAPTVTLFDSSTTEDRLGLGVGAADLTGGAAADLVAVSGGSLRVYVDGAVASPLLIASAASCPLEVSPDLVTRARLNRAVVIAPLLPGGGTQIAVGTPAAVGQGAVSIFGVGPGGITCLMSLTQGPNRFGQALATGDFDGDGHVDLLVGAPPHDAFLYKGPLLPSTQPAQITYADSAGEFGSALAALDIDGKPGDEAVIGDNQAPFMGTALAGAVVIYGGTGLGQQLALVGAHDPADGAAFGSTVSALPFCPAGCGSGARRLLLVGTATQAFTYFLLQPTDTDPRRR